MNQKICIRIDPQKLDAFLRDPRLMDSVVVTSQNDVVMMAIVYPHHAHLRFELGKIDGVVVLPGAHDPSPIGDLHKHLAHVNAEPHHTMREVSLRLHELHGPAFHPDT